MTDASRRLGPAEATWTPRVAPQPAPRAGAAPPERGPRRLVPDDGPRGSEEAGPDMGAAGTQEPDEAPGPASGASPGSSLKAGTGAAPRPLPAVADLDAAWAALPVLSVDPRHLRRNLVVTAHRTDPAHGAFDVLRTRVLGEMERRGWRRLGITSPTKGCGKTFTAVNLAVTLSRLANRRTLLLDLDLRRPAVGRLLGAARPGPIGEFLRGHVPPAEALARVGPNPLEVGRLALGLNGRPEPFAAELLGDARAAAALAAAEAWLGPDLTIFDLPPTLAQDDVLVLRPHYDALLLVAGGGHTTSRELKEAARRLGPEVPILGIVLNKAEGEGIKDYTYDDG